MDVVLAVVLFLGAMTVAATVPGCGPWTPVSAVLIGLQTLPLAVRRRYPVGVLAVTGVGIGIYSGLGYLEAGANFGVLVAFYTVAADTDRRTASVAAVLTAAGVLLTFANYSVKDTQAATELLTTGIIYSATWIVGDYVRQRREESVRLQGLAERLEHEREERARQAVADERARIARELHDVVAHHVSVMVVQAAAARRIATTDPAAAQAALIAVEGSGRTALAEMRRMLEVLRADDGPLAPQPGLAGLGTLLADVRAAGLPVELTIEGQPAELPPGVDLAAYRIVQEALTNVVKHAGRASARVRLGYAPSSIAIEVTDDGRGAAAEPGPDGAGHGLLGMRERVALYGGALETGPRPAGGFRVYATLSFDPPAGAPASAGRPRPAASQGQEAVVPA
jgi:signal transduction histidine kinase